MKAIVALELFMNQILLWDWSTNTFPNTFQARSYSSQGIFLRDGRFACQFDDQTTQIWNVTSMTVDVSLKCVAYRLEEMYNGWLATGDKNLQVWNVSSQGVLVKNISTGFSIECIKQLRTNNFLAVAGYNGKIAIYDPVKNLTLNKLLVGHAVTDIVYAMAELANGNLLTASGDYTVKLWNVTQNKSLSSLNVFNDQVFILKMISKDTVIISGYSSYIYVYNMNSKNQLSLNTSLFIDSNIYNVQVTETNLVMILFNNNTLQFYDRTNMALLNSYRPTSDNMAFISVPSNS